VTDLRVGDTVWYAPKGIQEWQIQVGKITAFNYSDSGANVDGVGSLLPTERLFLSLDEAIDFLDGDLMWDETLDYIHAAKEPVTP